MTRRATVEDILAAGEKEVPIPGLVDEQGEPMTIRVRKVHAGEREGLMPALPAHLFEELPDDPEKRTAELTDRRADWVKSLTPEQLDERTKEASLFYPRLVARASLDPNLTEEQAQRLGDAVVTIGAEIVAFSQNKPEKKSDTSDAGDKDTE